MLSIRRIIMHVTFESLAIGEVYTTVDFDDPEYRIKMVKVRENYAKDCEYGVTYACDGDEIVEVGSHD
jgi:hypothetical protein